MFYLKCESTNVKSCDFIARGRTKWEVKRSLFDHAAKHHKHLLLESSSADRRDIMDRMDRLMMNNE